MSFTIAVIDRFNEVYVAADNMISGLGVNESESYWDITKIIPFSDSAAVTISGTFDIARVVAMSYSKAYRDAMTMEMVMQQLRDTAVFMEIENLAKFGYRANCTFIVARQEKKGQRMAVLSLMNGENGIYYDPFVENGIQFFFSYPIDMDAEVCLNICKDAFKKSDYMSTKDVLEEIIHEIANHSAYVNHRIDVWKAARPRVIEQAF